MRRTFCLALLFLIALSARADGDGERAALSRLVGEIDVLAPLIAEAEAQSDHGNRVQFGYAWLRRDLETIKSGIREHLERPRTEPQPVTPLRGDYLNLK